MSNRTDQVNNILMTEAQVGIVIRTLVAYIDHLATRVNEERAKTAEEHRALVARLDEIDVLTLKIGTMEKRQAKKGKDRPVEATAMQRDGCPKHP